MGITWIFEGERDKVLGRIDLSPEPGGSVAKRYPCPFCKRDFDDMQAVQMHASSDHRLERPVLFLNGSEAPVDGRIHVLNRFDIANATASFVKVDGGPEMQVVPADLPLVLQGFEDSHVHVRIENGSERRVMPVVSSYRLDFRIADPKALADVELAFDEIVLDQPLSRSTIRQFLDDDRCSGGGRSYATGLYSYVLALLIKENPGGSQVSAYSEYPARFAESHSTLRTIDRPLARLVCSLVRLMRNDLSGPSEASGFPDIDIALAMLGGPGVELPRTPLPSIERRRICPIDHGTSRVVEIAARLSRLDRWSAMIDDECRQAASWETTDTDDRSKIFAYWASTAWRLGQKQAARHPLTQIAGVYPFETWASPHLRELRQ